VRRLPNKRSNDPAIEVHAGLAYSHDGSILWVATGDSGKVRGYRTASLRTRPSDRSHDLVANPAIEISLNGITEGKDFHDSFAASLILSADDKTLYVPDQANWRVVLVDVASKPASPRFRPVTTHSTWPCRTMASASM